MMLTLGLAFAGVDDGQACLSANDLICARRELDAARRRGASGRDVDLLEVGVRFQEGDFEGALQVARPWLEGEDALPDAELVAATAEVHRGLEVSERDGVVVVHHPGTDRVLIADAETALARARQVIGPALGGDLPLTPRVEFYPTGQDFVACSGLPMESVQTTGVIAISKWNRLLLTSPRATTDGYDWQDTLVHEWIHQVVSWHTRDRAPVWLQEGLAKSLDQLWRTGTFELPLDSQAYLADALETGQLITFEQMHPSMAFLPSAAHATLAYAQVATMIHFLRTERGPDALPDLLARVAAGTDAQVAVGQVWGGGFDAFEDAWFSWAKTLDLSRVKVKPLPTVLDGHGGDEALDPVLSAHEELSGRYRLGRLMAASGQHEAALVYYRESLPDDEPPGPVTVGALAESLVALGRTDEAVVLLEESTRLYPGATRNQRFLGELYLQLGRDRAALTRFEHAADLYPYDLAVRSELAELHDLRGDDEAAARHRAAIAILSYQDLSPAF